MITKKKKGLPLIQTSASPSPPATPQGHAIGRGALSSGSLNILTKPLPLTLLLSRGGSAPSTSSSCFRAVSFRSCSIKARHDTYLLCCDARQKFITFSDHAVLVHDHSSVSTCCPTDRNRPQYEAPFPRQAIWPLFFVRPLKFGTEWVWIHP